MASPLLILTTAAAYKKTEPCNKMRYLYTL